MSTLLALALLAGKANLPTVQIAKPMTAAVSQPVFLELPKGSSGLTLYNVNGAVIARCEKKDETFGNCKMEQGVTLDDVMNAWVHAYQDLQK